jgi:UDP-glucose 4-epimerase
VTARADGDRSAAAADGSAVANLESAPASAIVTGGAGFIGSHLVERLVEAGTRVLIVDDLSTGRTSNVPPAVEVAPLDIASGALEAVFTSWRPSVVFHLAAQASVPISFQDPLRDVAVNVIGTHRVARAARAAGAQRLVFVSSGGAIYGETRRPATEATIPAPASYYGLHKLAAEGHVALAGLPYAIARPSNVYGPRQRAGLEGAVVAAFIVQAREGALQIHGDGSQTRDFIHVRDVVDALCLLAAHPVSGTWNVSHGQATSIAELADVVEGIVGVPLERRHLPRREGDVTSSAMTAGPLRRLGWRPTVDLRAGIRGLVEGAKGP